MDDQLDPSHDLNACAREIASWIVRTLDKPSPDHSGQAPCPFAVVVTTETDLLLRVSDDIAGLAQHKAHRIPAPALMQVLLNPPPPAELRAWVQDQNANHFGFWTTAWHPADPSLPACLSWLTERNLALVKVLDIVSAQEASVSLRQTPYYVLRHAAKEDALARQAAYHTHLRHMQAGFDHGDDHALEALTIRRFA